MAVEKIYEDLTPLLKRVRKTLRFIKIFALFIILCFWKIQILDHDKYWKLAESNRTREVSLPAPRGLIRTREGIILADNNASFNVSVIRENCKSVEESYERIAKLLEIDKRVLMERIGKYKSLPPWRPIVIKDNLSFEEVSRIEARKSEYSEIIVQAEPRRNYPFQRLASHVLGYLQEVSAEDLQKGAFSEKRMGDLVGKNGIERTYERILAGREGKLIELIDSLGRSRGELRREDPLPGKEIYLTLDFDLQKKAEELLEGKEGAIIILRSKTGEVLALASYPNYDPNKFINRFSPQEWMELIKRTDFPLENRALRGLYAPGSVFKLTMALAALDLNLITPQTSFYCEGQIQIYGNHFSCWVKGGHGSVNLYEGIRQSCNIFFYQLGRRMGIEAISTYASRLGFGEKTGIDLPGEKEGLVPSPQWKENARRIPWYPGETISVSIGQGPLLVTPLQIAAHTALIANRGRKIVPHLLKSVVKGTKRDEESAFLSPGQRIEIKPDIFEEVIKGMWGSVNDEGTGRAAYLKDFEVCGKTGSTQLLSRRGREKQGERKDAKIHSWFTGFAPKNDPEVVITVLVEFGGMGGKTAAPLAKELLKLYKEKYDR